MKKPNLPDDPLKLLDYLDSIGLLRSRSGGYIGRTPTDDILDEIDKKLGMLISNRKPDPEHINAVRQLKAAKGKLVRLQKRARFKLSDYSDKDLEKIADKTRKKNGKINYTAMAKVLACNPDTVKRQIFDRNLTHLIDGPIP